MKTTFKIGLMAMIFPALLGGCKKASVKVAEAKPFFTEEVVSKISKKYSPIDTVFVKEKQPNSAQMKHYKNLDKAENPHSSIGVNNDGYAVEMADDYHGNRVAIQLDKNAKPTKRSEFQKGWANNATSLFDKDGIESNAVKVHNIGKDYLGWIEYYGKNIDAAGMEVPKY